jgi:hypothetical protein
MTVNAKVKRYATTVPALKSPTSTILDEYAARIQMEPVKEATAMNTTSTRART